MEIEMLLLSFALASSFTLVSGIGGDWFRGATSVHSHIGDLSLDLPSGSAIGDVMVLFLSRSDSPVPVGIDAAANSGRPDQWQLGPNCVKDHNGQPYCMTLPKDCVRTTNHRDGDNIVRKYCSEFSQMRYSNGTDLATVVFTRTITRDIIRHPKRYLKWRLWESNRINDSPAWAILSVIRGIGPSKDDISVASSLNPGQNPYVRGFSGASCDQVKGSRFPSVPNAELGDLLLWHTAVDDRVPQSWFRSPDNTAMPVLQYIAGRDETSVLFGGPVRRKGNTGRHTTIGQGKGPCKDEVMSIVLRGGPPPTKSPTRTPTPAPTPAPSPKPTPLPSALPSSNPSSAPSTLPSSNPSAVPSTLPSSHPSSAPSTSFPTEDPSSRPSLSFEPSSSSELPVEKIDLATVKNGEDTPASRLGDGSLVPVERATRDSAFVRMVSLTWVAVAFSSIVSLGLC